VVVPLQNGQLSHPFFGSVFFLGAPTQPYSMVADELSGVKQKKGRFGGSTLCVIQPTSPNHFLDLSLIL
jgi:hypothetical protein